MYGLKQAALLCYKMLTEILNDEEYIKIPSSLELWKHKTKKTLFSLCVDNFSVKYYNIDDLNHLKTTLQSKYVVKTDMGGTNFLNFTLKWNCPQGFVDLSMPGYLENALDKLQYTTQVYPQYSPHQHHPINYSRKKGKRPTATEPDTSPLLSPDKIVYIQQAVGTLLYYARALDNTMLTTLNDIGTQQALPTQKVKQKVQQLLDYANTYKKILLDIRQVIYNYMWT